MSIRAGVLSMCILSVGMLNADMLSADMLSAGLSGAGMSGAGALPSCTLRGKLLSRRGIYFRKRRSVSVRDDPLPSDASFAYGDEQSMYEKESRNKKRLCK